MITLCLDEEYENADEMYRRNIMKKRLTPIKHAKNSDKMKMFELAMKINKETKDEEEKKE